MSNEVLPFISNEVVELFEEFDDDYLADVLRPWDCDAQDWLDHTTTVFRFENDDLLVWNEMGRLKAMRGIVDTQSFDASLLAPARRSHLQACVEPRPRGRSSRSPCTRNCLRPLIALSLERCTRALMS